MERIVRPSPASIPSCRAIDRKQPTYVGERRRAPEPSAETIVYAKRDEETNRQKGQQLDERLEGDRCDHPFVSLRGVKVARAEQDREGGQDQGDVQRRILKHRQRRKLRRPDDLRVLEQ